MAWSILFRRIKFDTYSIYGTIIVFAFVLALHGILQYVGISSNRSVFAITGSFDNPAGFAAALACALPLCFLFFKKNENYLRYSAIAAAGIMAIAIVLSGSRAGIFAVLVASTTWLLLQSKIISQKSKIALVVALAALPLVLYFFKKDSADGRLLIWRCTMDMVADKPVFGHGHGAFQANYMLYQAEYFKANPDSRYAQLADNVMHPFNEYLLILSQYGIAGLSVFILLVFLLIRTYRRNPSDEKLAALLSLLALAVFSFFSYPFRYPFSWAMVVLCMSVIFNIKIGNQKLLWLSR